MTLPNNSSANSMPERHRPMDGEPRLLFWRDACLAARSAPDACRRCEEVCPAATLSVRNDGPERIAACLGCGRCAAACPTGALAVKGFQKEALPNGNEPLRVECWKVPHRLTSPESIRVPCLGGITLPQLLSWCDAAPRRPILYVDHGWCAGCTAGGARHPGNAVLQQANHLLAACGRPSETLPAWISHPLPSKLMPADIPEPVAAEALGRRAFFRRFVSEIAASVPPPAAAPAPIKSLRRQSACPMPAHEQVLELLPRLAAHHGRPAPDALLPVLKISADCQHHAVCSGVCPTGALLNYEEPHPGNEKAAHAGIEFDPDYCIACGLCAESCPEGAITVEPQGGSHGVQRLTAHKMHTCTRCRHEFAGAGPGLCPRCQQQREQAGSLFGTVNALRE